MTLAMSTPRGLDMAPTVTARARWLWGNHELATYNGKYDIISTVEDDKLTELYFTLRLNYEATMSTVC